MRSSIGALRHEHRETHTLHLILRDGFQRHRVLITMNERTVYQSAEVTTAASATPAEIRPVVSRSRIAHLVVSVTPGNQAATFDVDVDERPYVAISLIGEGTVAFETSTLPFG